MPRFKPYSYEQTKMIPLSFDRQILPGTFEYTISKTVNTLDLTLFHRRFKNDDNGAPAFDPAILLKIVLYAYSKGVVSSRKIAQLCDENVVFMALSADSHPHFTTIADFVSSMQEEILPLFRQVVLVCLELDLIEGSMFAIDGCKISSNASKEWSGTNRVLKKSPFCKHLSLYYRGTPTRSMREVPAPGGMFSSFLRIPSAGNAPASSCKQTDIGCAAFLVTLRRCTAGWDALRYRRNGF